MSKIVEFDNLHTESGELYQEFVKFGCRQKTDRLCDWCKKHGFVGPVPCGRIRRHFPDYSPESSSLIFCHTHECLWQAKAT